MQSGSRAVQVVVFYWQFMRFRIKPHLTGDADFAHLGEAFCVKRGKKYEPTILSNHPLMLTRCVMRASYLCIEMILIGVVHAFDMMSGKLNIKAESLNCSSICTKFAVLLAADVFPFHFNFILFFITLNQQGKKD